MSIPESHRNLRTWVIAHTGYGHPVRDEFARAAQSAVLRRLLIFGAEDALRRYDARALLGFQTMCTGEFAAMLARIAFTRAVVENDREALAAIANAGIAEGQLAWLSAFSSVDAAGATALIANITDTMEELHVARLVVARRHPELIQAAWLWEVPTGLPLVAAELCRVTLFQRSDLAVSAGELLARDNAVLFASEPDDLLARLVAVSAVHPQHVLQPFEGRYGEPTVVAAAEWHLEHSEPREALQLCSRIRPLAPEADRARAIAAIAQMELGDLIEARELLHAVRSREVADATLLRLAEFDPLALTNEDLIDIARRCPATRPETFFTALRLLFTHQALEPARRICRERAAEFAGNPALDQLFKAVLGEAHG